MHVSPRLKGAWRGSVSLAALIEEVCMTTVERRTVRSLHSFVLDAAHVQDDDPDPLSIAAITYPSSSPLLVHHISIKTGLGA